MPELRLDVVDAAELAELLQFISQWLAEPTPCPLDRTEVGKTSPIYTQITAPCERAKKPI